MLDRKELFAVFKQLAPECYGTSKSKGFWDEGENRNKGKMVMLMVSELGEACDAHRKGRMAPKINQETIALWNSEDDIDLWKSGYELHVKGTVGEELADFIIRVLDYVHGWKLNFDRQEFRKDSTKDFSNDLLKLVNWSLEAYHGQVERESSKYWGAKDWGYLLTATIAFCDWWDIDIISNLQWKMKYNTTREYMHGKSY